MDLHFIQAEILKRLLQSTGLKFSEMQPEEITSKHFNYHLKRLIENGYVLKQSNAYVLTDKGKDFVGKRNELNMKLEIQPKISVAIVARRFVGNVEEVLLSKRLKQPYYGKVGGFTGKVRFGEKFESAARREFEEETGLTGDFRLSGLTRKFAYKAGQKDAVQDNIMVLFSVENTKGDLIENPGESENFWYPYQEVKKRKDLYNTFLGFLEITRNQTMKNFELEVEAEGF